MDRRELLAGAAAMAALAASGGVFAAGEHDHMDMNMGDMQHDHVHKSTRNQKLISAASDCVMKAQVCLQHCLVLMGRGDKELAACAQSSSQVEAMCAALESIAVAESKLLPALAKVVMDACKNCEDECKKPEVAKHEECKACGEACAACYKECKAIVI